MVFYYPIYNIDYPGNDLGNGVPIKTDYPGCAFRCTKTTGCTSFVFDPQQNNCWLKRVLRNGKYFPGSTEQMRISYFKSPYTFSGLNYATDYPGNDITYANVEFAVCRDVCKRTAGCKGIGLDISVGKGCWLKRAFGVAVYSQYRMIMKVVKNKYFDLKLILN